MFTFLSIMASVLGVIIAIVSFLGASRELILMDDKLTELRKIPVDSYRFPETGMLPDNIFYRFKEWRDWWWLKTTDNREKRVELAIFQADKKWLEAVRLIKKGEIKLAVWAGRNGLDRLQYASLQKEGVLDEWKRKEFERTLAQAVAAYRELIKTEKLEGLDELLDEWDETQTKKNY